MRTFFPALALAAFVSAAGCGGQSDGDDSQGSQVAVAPGDPCDANGATAPSVDGCNTCNCVETAWTCTRRACTVPGGICAEGTTKPAGDGCNTCSCVDGDWACTLTDCAPAPDPPPPPADECPAPREPVPNYMCILTVIYAQAPDTGLCCVYANGCVSPEGWAVYTSEKECLGGGSGLCTPGEMTNDGCNTCLCTESGWACTDRACPEMCKPGQTRRAEDGCNVCTCGDNGLWGGCTEIGCVPGEPNACGGFAGFTCTDDEYCAYVEGQLCGGADASATCEKRPEACTLELAPVCGCDGMDYGNACAANAAGSGVNHSGACSTL